jgi:hypothetical protein
MPRARRHFDKLGARFSELPAGRGRYDLWAFMDAAQVGGAGTRYHRSLPDWRGKTYNFVFPPATRS